MSVSTVVHNKEGEKITEWKSGDPVRCLECNYLWKAVYPSGVRELICPQCKAFVPLTERKNKPTLKVNVVSQLENGETEKLKDLRGGITLRMELTAPQYFWSQLLILCDPIAIAPLSYPLTADDFVEYVYPKVIAAINAANDEHNMAVTLNDIPKSVIRNGVFSPSYLTVDKLAEEHRFDTSYEWRQFLSQLKGQLILKELCPWLEVYKGGQDL